MSLSREKAKELKGSQMWDEFLTELDDMITAARNQLEIEGKEKFDKWQSRIATLKEIKQVPQIAIDR